MKLAMRVSNRKSKGNRRFLLTSIFWIIGIAISFLVVLTLDEARKIDPSLDDMPDEELRAVMETLYGLGRLAYDLVVEKSAPPTTCNPNKEGGRNN